MKGTVLKTGLVLAWLWILLASTPLLARDTQYSASVPVADRSEKTRAMAVREALGVVLVGLSGDPAVLRQAGSAALLAKANRYLQQYQYEGGEAALALQAGFDGAALESDMRQQGLSLWGRERPATLVWLAVDDGSRQYLLGADPADAVHSALTKAGGNQGLALILPLMDLQDQAQLSYNDVASGMSGGVSGKLQSASQRYAARAILVGQLQHKDMQWSSRWRLQTASGVSDWQASASALSATLEQGLSQAAERLTQRSAPSPVGQSAAQFTLRVEGVTGLDDYARISEYLSGLGPVRSATLVSAHAQRLDFLVDAQGGAAGFDQTLAQGGMLEHAPAAVADGVQTYRLRR